MKENEKIYTNSRKFEPDHDQEIMTIGMARALMESAGMISKANKIFHFYKKNDTANLIKEINNNKDNILFASKIRAKLTQGDKDAMKTHILGGKFVWMVYKYA